MQKIAYFPGCTLKTTAQSMETSAMASAEKLGYEMVELPDWVCCGVVPSLTSDDLMRHLAPLRNMVRLEGILDEGLVDDGRLLTLCSMCFNTLRRTDKRIRENPDDLTKLNDFMYKENDYTGRAEILHFLEMLDNDGLEKIGEKLQRSLDGMKIAPYYGCMLLRPKEIGIDDPERPTIMHRFIEQLGGAPVNWNAGARCCGSYHTVSEKDIVVELVKGILENARKHKAEAVITTCPLCAFNLDDRQKDIREKYPEFQSMPVFYFSQLLGLALGVETEKLGLDDKAKAFLQAKGLM